MVRTDGSKQILPSKCDRVKVHPGDVLHYVTWGGGGWGDPLTRDPELVARDVRRGLVSRKAAQSYGVLIRDDGTVDNKGTERLRATTKSKRGAVSIFDFGGSIDELRARCRKETGLSAPTPPQFAQLAGD
jgi:N-methylhydantoinase B